MRSNSSLPKAFLAAAIFCGTSQSQTQPAPPPKPPHVVPRAIPAAPPPPAKRVVTPAAAAPRAPRIVAPGPVVRVRPRVAMPVYVPPPVFVAPVYVAPVYVPPPVLFEPMAPPNMSSGFGEDAGLVAPPDVNTSLSDPEPVARPEVQMPPAASWPAAMAPEQPPSFQDLASDWKKPGPDYVFLPGYFFYDGSFVWVKGHWELPPFAGAEWVPYRWTQTPSGWWALHKGYWQ